jgi:hypothetical protein
MLNRSYRPLDMVLAAVIDTSRRSISSVGSAGAIPRQADGWSCCTGGSGWGTGYRRPGCLLASWAPTIQCRLRKVTNQIDVNFEK